MGLRAINRNCLVILAFLAVGVFTAVVSAQGEERLYDFGPNMVIPEGSPGGTRIVPPDPRARIIEGSSNRRVRTSRDGNALELPMTGRTQLTTPTHRSSRTQTSTTSPRLNSSRSTASRSSASSTSSASTIRRAPGARRDPSEPLEYGRLIVITEFDEVAVSVEGQPYPYGSMQGVILIAGEQYEVALEALAQDGSRSEDESSNRVISVRVAPSETRVLMANLDSSGSSRSSARSQSSRRSRIDRSRSRGDDEEDEMGYLGVSSSPRGIVYVDDENTGQMTPARRIELEPGRHEVRIFYESEDRFSETKNVLIRAGVNTNVFFRDRRQEDEEDEEEE